MFLFEDFAGLDNKTLSNILAAVPPEVIAVALGGASESTQKRFFSCMTESKAELTQFEMDRKGAPQVGPILDNQREMIRIARGLEQQNKVKLVRNTKIVGQS